MSAATDAIPAGARHVSAGGGSAEQRSTRNHRRNESYATGGADSDQVQRRLRRVRPSHAPLLVVDAVELVDVAAGLGPKTITWERLVRIPLAGST